MSELLPGLDETFHAKARLGIMTVLVAGEEADFTTLKSRLGLTDGNLGAHLRVLEHSGYIEIVKGYAGRRPRTVCRATDAGRAAFAGYLRELEAVIRMAQRSAQ